MWKEFEKIYIVVNRMCFSFKAIFTQKTLDLLIYRNESKMKKRQSELDQNFKKIQTGNKICMTRLN